NSLRAAKDKRDREHVYEIPGLVQVDPGPGIFQINRLLLLLLVVVVVLFLRFLGICRKVHGTMFVHVLQVFHGIGIPRISCLKQPALRLVLNSRNVLATMRVQQNTLRFGPHPD
ncbi:hypothetical protein, partial [Endozoicomonas sp. ONNA2]|uniref:hypothetical protein n=1 Tax=Endozoicomonas sp. ONNA2 TaxID=2828741 RepID=UPI0021490AA2